MEDELISIDAIYGPGTLTSHDRDAHHAVLTLPARPDISIRVAFPIDYPDTRPSILGPESTGQDVAKGQGNQLSQLMDAILQEIWTPGEPCVFALIEECTSRLAEDQKVAQVALLDGGVDESEQNLLHSRHTPQVSEAQLLDHANPDWILSDVVTEKKSVFVARVAAVSAPSQAKQNVAHLLATDKKAAKATHNITAWRIKGESGVQYQDCDDDGETAAGGRLLHLLELMDAWDVMVVVTRWYGGVHLGPDRFRLINQVARDALVAAGYTDHAGKKKGKR